MKLQMAAFLQDTVEEMAVTSKNPKKVESVQEFADFIKKVCVCVSIWVSTWGGGNGSSWISASTY